MLDDPSVPGACAPSFSHSLLPSFRSVVHVSQSVFRFVAGGVSLAIGSAFAAAPAKSEPRA